ncbi:SDR family oxidoreductase [Planomonospora venezuelensis]|uniref:Uncharacterized protein YbjT (DUF2867 family) n=1 Tax=Planomonospora venezuelensis TaxID=1999 RepID=A0A841CSM6_PLAVE|nr:NAD-dependent epimerase/dehydratase family protein [Planomonospora venezuelensis]MBB5961432.1 uncharacterized protein YbjT (DUF2867 family) [Planomonospora venezuelensis]GIN03178.1 hydroxylase [Planomonospora venezuelensis]
MTSKTVAVHGATGVQGSHIARRLRAAGYEVRPLDTRSADLTDPHSLVRAYGSAGAVVVHLPLVFAPVAVAYAETLLTALAKAGIARAVFNPGMALPPEPVGVPYVDARIMLARRLPDAVGKASVIGPAGTYLENLLMPWSVRRVREEGEVAYPLPAGAPMPWVTLDDVGDAVAAALGEDHPAAVSVLAGPPITGERVAAAVGAAAGRQTRWNEVTPEEYRRLLEPVLGGDAAAGVAEVYRQAAAAPPPPPPPAGILRPAPTTVERWAARQDWTA